jgi:hypothetical protein
MIDTILLMLFSIYLGYIIRYAHETKLFEL